VVVAALVASFFAYRALTGMIEQFTDIEPKDLPVIEADPDKTAALEEEVQTFADAVEKGTADKPLVLTEEDINTLIQHSEKWQELRGKLYVTIEEGRVSGSVSIPLDDIRLSIVRGRYLNADVTLSISLDHGALEVYFTSIRVKDKPLPEMLMTELTTYNFAQDFLRDPETRDLIRRFEKVEIRDDAVVLVPTSGGSDAPLDAQEESPVETASAREA